MHPQSESKWSRVHVSNGNVLPAMRKSGGYGLPSSTCMGSISCFCHQPACVSFASPYDSCIFSSIVFVLPPCSLHRGTFLPHVTVVHSSLHFGGAQILPCTPKGSPSQLEPLCPFMFRDLTALTSAALSVCKSLPRVPKHHQFLKGRFGVSLMTHSIPSAQNCGWYHPTE